MAWLSVCVYWLSVLSVCLPAKVREQVFQTVLVVSAHHADDCAVSRQGTLHNLTEYAVWSNLNDCGTRWDLLDGLVKEDVVWEVVTMVVRTTVLGLVCLPQGLGIRCADPTGCSQLWLFQYLLKWESDLGWVTFRGRAIGMLNLNNYNPFHYLA